MSDQPNETTLHVPHDPGCCIVLTPPDVTLNDLDTGQLDELRLCDCQHPRDFHNTPESECMASRCWCTGYLPT